MRFNFSLQLSGIGQRVAVHFFAYSVEDFAGRPNTEVGGKQGRLKLFQQRRIDLSLAEKNLIDGLGKNRLGLADRSLQFLKQRGFWLVFSEKGNHRVPARPTVQHKIVAEAAARDCKRSRAHEVAIHG